MDYTYREFKKNIWKDKWGHIDNLAKQALQQVPADKPGKEKMETFSQRQRNNYREHFGG